MFVVHLLSCAAPSAFAADTVGLRTRAYTRVSVKRTCLGGAQRDQAPEWVSKLPEARKSILLLETLATAVPARQMDGPLSQAVEALAEGHAVLRDSQEERKAALLVLLASSGKGKSRFLYELNQLLQKQSRAMCIPITFNGRQNLEIDAQTVKRLTKEPEERALVHVVLRLLHATFAINDLQLVARSFCESLKANNVPLDVSLLREVVAECAKTRDSVENLTILVDESGRLPKLLNMQKGDGDEFSVLRSLCAPASVNSLGFSVMLMQAGLGDFAEQTVSSRDVKVITLLEQEIEDALKRWVLYEADSKASVQRWLNSFVGLCCGKSLKTKANNTELYNKLVLRPLVVAERLTPAVLAPAILPSHRLLVSLKQEIGGHRVSKLLSEGAYANALQKLRGDAEFLPTIVPAFLRQAAQIQPELEEVLKAQAGGAADAGNLLDVGVRLWTYTILLALSENQPTLKMTLADIFPNCVTHRGLEAADYKMQIPNAVTLKVLQEPLNASEKILQFAIRSARQGRATVLDLADGQAEQIQLLFCLCKTARCCCLAWSRTAAPARDQRRSNATQGILKTSGQCFGRAFHPQFRKRKMFGLLCFTSLMTSLLTRQACWRRSGTPQSCATVTVPVMW